MGYSFRVTGDFDDQMKTLENAFIVKEFSDKEKEHYHGLVEVNVTRQTVLNWLKAALGDKFQKGNKFYSIKTTDDTEAARRYLSKGKDVDTLPNVIVNGIGFNPTDYHKQYWDINTSLKTKKKKDNRTAKQMFKDYYNDCITNNIISVTEIEPKRICDAYLAWLRDMDLEPTPSSSARAMIMGLYIKHAPSRGADQYDLKQEFYRYCGFDRPF